MRFSLQREVFLKPLAQVVNVVERRQTLPVLANLLVQVKDGQLSLTGTDLEVEMVARMRGRRRPGRRNHDPGAQAVRDRSRPARRQQGHRLADGDKITVQAGRSRFTLATLPANDFPSIDEVEADRARARAGSGAEGADRTHRVRDGAAGRALLPQRPAVRPARDQRCAAWPPTATAWRCARPPLDERRADQAPDHRAAQGRAGTAAPARRRRPRARAGNGPQPPARASATMSPSPAS